MENAGFWEFMAGKEITSVNVVKTKEKRLGDGKEKEKEKGKGKRSSDDGSRKPKRRKS
jgi:hypothetical protein